MGHTRRANRYCALCQPGDGVVSKGTILLLGEVEIDDTVKILGRFQAEDGCELHKRVVVKDTTLGSHVTVGAYSGIYDSVIGNDSAIGKRCVIHDVTIGDNVHIGDDVHIGPATQVEDNVVIGTVESGTTIGEWSWIKKNSDIQGTLNYRDKNTLHRVDLVKAGEVIPAFNMLVLVNGKRVFYDLTPEPPAPEPTSD